MRGCTNDTLAAAMVEGIVRIEALLHGISSTGSRTGVKILGIGSPTGDKSQSGMPPAVVARAKQTAINPVLLEAPAFWLIMLNIPSLPQLPPSSRVLKSLWPRLQKFSVCSDADPLWAPCEAGAAGNESQARRCMGGWQARVPGLRAQVEQVRKALWETFPNETPDGKAYAALTPSLQTHTPPFPGWSGAAALRFGLALPPRAARWAGRAGTPSPPRQTSAAAHAAAATAATRRFTAQGTRGSWMRADRAPTDRAPTDRAPTDRVLAQVLGVVLERGGLRGPGVAGKSQQPAACCLHTLQPTAYCLHTLQPTAHRRQPASSSQQRPGTFEDGRPRHGPAGFTATHVPLHTRARARARVCWCVAKPTEPTQNVLWGNVLALLRGTLLQVSQFGASYARLLELKTKYDPHGLFYGHHAVGSELWDASGNCRKDKGQA